MMRRRQFLRALALVGLATGGRVPVAEGQERVYKVAWLAGAGREQNLPLRKILVERLAGAGFVEGRNLKVIGRFAEGQLERVPDLARELAKESPDVFLVHGTQPAEAVKNATRGVPIVFAFVSDPVASGLVSDLSHPGGTVTGFTNMNYELIGKRLEVLREAFPQVGGVAVLYNPRNAPDHRMLEFVRKAAPALKIEITALEIASVDDFSRIFAAMERRRPDALFVIENVANSFHRRLIFDFAAARASPTCRSSFRAISRWRSI